MSERKDQVEISGYVRNDIVGSRSTFSFYIDTNEWSGMTDDEQEQLALDSMLESIDWDYEAEIQDDSVVVNGRIKTNTINSESTFNDHFLIEDWQGMSDTEQDKAVLDNLLTSGMIEWDYTPPDTGRSLPSP